MTATNHTKNYNLSQFAGTDRPTWLGDGIVRVGNARA